MLAFVATVYAVLLFAVLVHECGHAVMCWVLRCPPRMISLGSGPLLFRLRIGRVWLVLRAFPLSGFVLHLPLRGTPVLAPALVLAAGPAANILCVWALSSVGEAFAVTSIIFQSMMACASIFPYSYTRAGTRFDNDGHQLRKLLFSSDRRDDFAAAYANMSKAVLGDGVAPPPATRESEEVILQTSRFDRLEPKGFRQSMQALREVVAREVANDVERGFANRYLAEMDAWHAATHIPRSWPWSLGWRPSPATRYYAALVVSCVVETLGLLSERRRVQVLCFDDNATPMEFVVAVLEQIFEHPNENAVALMLRIHRGGRALCGVYSPARAQVLITAAADLAQRKGHPLRFLTRRQLFDHRPSRD